MKESDLNCFTALLTSDWGRGGLELEGGTEMIGAGSDVKLGAMTLVFL